jgi:hypothetical protein
LKPGRNIPNQARIKRSRPGYGSPGLVHSKLGQHSLATRLGRHSLAWLGQRLLNPAGPMCSPGWAGISFLGLAAFPSLARPLRSSRPLRSPPRLGWQANPDQAGIPSPGRCSRQATTLAGWGRSPGQNMPAGPHLGTVPTGPGQDFPGPGRISPLWARIYSLWGISFMRH